MVFRKYRAIKDFSKNNTRIFKDILKAKNARKLPKFEVPEALLEKKIKIYDPNFESFVSTPNPILEQFKNTNLNSININKPDTKDHPLYKKKECLLFESEEPFSDGVDQACNLTNAILRKEFPSIFHDALKKIAIPKGFEDEVKDCILGGERFDPTLEKLPRRFDPVLFWIVHPRIHGTPVVKRGNIILANICRKFQILALGNDEMKDTRVDFDSPLSGMLNLPGNFNNKPLVVRGCPHIILQNTSPTKLWSPLETVKGTKDEKVPELRAIEATLDLRKENIYNEESVIVRSDFPLFINTIMYTMENSQKYPWTREQLGANVIMNCFGAALAQARRITSHNMETKTIDEIEKELQERPLVTKAIQLCDGKLDIAVFQLNSLLMDKKGIKNEVWLKSNLQLYKTKPYWENMDTVEELNMEIVEDFCKLVLC
uniref:39S ribosomal protein L37, mitochondrial (inferred by orthology to a human protein) n=1 Tax=Strongyloides venezuelensis TaxID=75913 RepID=A0A0K0FYH5_STRVS